MVCIDSLMQQFRAIGAQKGEAGACRVPRCVSCGVASVSAQRDELGECTLCDWQASIWRKRLTKLVIGFIAEHAAFRIQTTAHIRLLVCAVPAPLF